MLRKIFFTLAIILLVMGGDASAQSPVSQMQVRAVVYKAITVTKVNELAFGKLAVGLNGGSVTMSMDGIRSSQGDIALVSSTTNAAWIEIVAEPAMPVTITMDNVINLNDGSSHLLELTLNASQPIGEPIFLDGTGTLPVHIGGTVQIPQGAPVGNYSGTVNFSVVYY